MYIYIYMYVCTYRYMCIYVRVCRERERWTLIHWEGLGPLNFTNGTSIIIIHYIEVDL